MTLIKLDKVKKYYGDRLILDIDNLEINEGDRIGIVGENGAGKTTLIKVILGNTEIDEGNVFLDCNYSYIGQTEEYHGDCTDGKIKSLLGTPDKYNSFLSGGEKVKINITKALSSNSNLLIADEPTSNLDAKTIKTIEKLIGEYKGGLLLVSHDRDFLNSLCNTILEVSHGKVKLYKGNYSKYIELKNEEESFKKKEYEEYLNEKKRLEKAIIGKETQRDSIRRTPKRMGNSEARLFKMGDQKSKKHLDGNIKALKSRIKHLDVKEKPVENKDIIIKIVKGSEMPSKTVIEVRDFNLYVTNKLLAENINLKIKNRKKAALIGENGCGKTSLVREIIKNTSDNIKLSNHISIGYFDQNQEILNKDKTILKNIKESSSLDESIIRINLNNFGFAGDDVFKKVSILSSGEKVKVALCKIILSDNNTLILDEPTNFLDIKSIVALENALKNTEKTLLIISHDRHFISNVCDYIIEMKDNKITCFSGTYDEFIQDKENFNLRKSLKNNERERKEKLLILETKLSKLISEISFENNSETKANLDLQYQETLQEIKKLKSN